MKTRLSRKELMSTNIDFKQLSEEELIDYINLNVKKARYKINYLSKTGYYRVSQQYKDATYNLNIFNRKYGIEDNKVTGSKRFLSSRTVGVSKAELKSLARSINSLIKINTRDISKLYRETVAKYAKIGVSYEQAYNVLSRLGKEFREIYTLLSYNEVSELVKSGECSTVEEILAKFYEKLEYIKPTDKQEHHITALNSKLVERYDSQSLASIFGNEF